MVYEEEDQLAPAKGIMNALFIVLPIWAVIVALWMIFR
jgi:hypothetical protein